MRRHLNLYLIMGALLALAFLSSSVAKAAPAAAVPGYSLTANPMWVDQGEFVSISWTKPAGSPYGFIGLYFANDFTTLVNYTYPESVGNSGTVTLQVPEETGGYWVAWVDGGVFKTMTLIQVTLPHTAVSTPGYSLVVDPNPVGPGDTILVNWVKPAGAPRGFIGLYDSTDDHSPGDGSGSFLDFRYASETGDSGTVSFVAPDEPGGYWVGWVSLTDSSYKSVVPFAVATEGGAGGDDDAPEVSLTAPADGAVVSGPAVTVSADATDNVGVVGVQFQLDGADLGAEVQSSPYSVTWDTATVPNGSHVLTAVARDEAGNQATSSAVTVTVDNGGVPPGPFAKISPANGAAGQPHVPTLSWGTSSGAANYEYCVDTINNNSCDTNWTSTGSTSVAAGGLNSGTHYFWQVRAHNSSGTVESDSGAWWSFTTSVGSHVNVAAAINGGSASASSFINAGYAPGGAIDGDRKGLNWGSGGGWNDGTDNAFPDWLQVDFAGPQSLDEIDVVTVQDDYTHPVEPALGLPFTLYGITSYQVQYWDGLSWAIVPGGNITGNNQVWRQIAFGAITTTKIRIYVTGALNAFSRITEVEAYADLNILPGSFAKISPANAAASQPLIPALSWGASSGATSYEYCVDTTNNNSCDTSWISTGSGSAIAGGLSAGTTYFWQVRARNGAGTTEADTGAWWSFTTQTGGHVNVAAAANGGVASASSFYNDGYGPASAINGDRKGLGWGSGGGWNDATPSSFPDWLQVDFAGSQTIHEIDVVTLQDDFTNPVEPTVGLPFTLYGITSFQAQYWDGFNWITVPAGNINGNNKIWRLIEFAPITTQKIRILVNGALNGYSRITEVEAYSDLSVVPGPLAKSSPANGAAGQALVPTLSWGTSSGATSYEYCVDSSNNNTCDTSWTSTSATSAVVGGLNAGTYFWQVRARNSTGATEADGGTWWTFTTSSSVTNPAANVASAANGASATASSFFSGAYAPGGAIDGDRKGLNWGNGGGWNDATASSYPDTIQINFAGPKTISEIDVFTLQDNYLSPIDPALSTTFTQYGITNFQVQYWDGSNWVNVPNGSISGNTSVWRRIAFPSLTTTGIRINVTGALNSYSRITEVEAY